VYGRIAVLRALTGKKKGTLSGGTLYMGLTAKEYLGPQYPHIPTVMDFSF
jgi:hypothetical protein